MNVECNDVPVSQNILEYEDERDKILLGPVSHIVQTVPTDTWEEFARAFNYWLNVPDNVFKDVAKSFRYFYYGACLCEALRDNPALSACDKSSCISIYGEACTINALVHIHLLAAKNLVRLNRSKAPAVHLEQTEEACIAQCMEQQWIETFIYPTEAEYYHMIVKQTSGHIGAQIKFLQLCSTNQNNFQRLLGIFGLFLRILGDYQYFIAAEGSDCKFYLPNETLEGLSLPIIHAVNSETMEGKTIIEMLHRRSNIEEMKKYAVSLLEKIGSLEYTRKTLMKLREEALREMRKFEKNPLLEKLFDKHFNIPQPSGTVAIETSMDSIKVTTETLKISSYLNQMENVKSDEEMKKMLLIPFNHINKLDKRTHIRHIFALFNESINTPEDKFSTLTKFMSTFGYTAFMLDDMQDNSILRKRIPCSYLIYGVMATINSVLYKFSMSFQNIVELNEQKAVDLYYDYTLEMFRGQGLELYWRDNYICPTEEEYTDMVNGKAGAFISLILNLMKVCSTSTINVDKIALPLSMYMQVYDDYENLIGQECHEFKGFCDDISEGKFGFPTVHAINTHPKEELNLIDILRQRTQDVDVKKKFLSILEKCGSFDYTREKLREFRKQFAEELAQFSQKNQLQSYLKDKFHFTFDGPHTGETYYS